MYGMQDRDNRRDRIALGLEPDHTFVLFRRFSYADGRHKWKRFGFDEWQSKRKADEAVSALRNAHPNHVYSIRRKRI